MHKRERCSTKLYQVEKNEKAWIGNLKVKSLRRVPSLHESLPAPAILGLGERVCVQVLNGVENFRRWRLLIFTLLFSLSSSKNHGAPMGPHKHCDDGESDISIDWDPESTTEYTCTGDRVEPDLNYVPSEECDKDPEAAFHECYPRRITYNGIPTSGMHRPVWAAYGEYKYCPPQRWLHNLEHSAIVMLYHPCVNETEANPLKKLLSRCVRRHLITPSKLLNISRPFALLTWGCKLIMSTVNLTLAEKYIRDHARDGPELKTYSSGRYNVGLINSASTPRGSDYHDSLICPKAGKEYQEYKEKEKKTVRNRRAIQKRLDETAFMAEALLEEAENKAYLVTR
ncbi:hypothetical protein LOTGIDRAFT_228331 [Lottia gigantea]|uniref:Uncharacterized protein n=1 Tax=Lottia gigantea TaxID=225164 RepID=V4ASB1_LOTGI|nr:hypothetical protein LOTGIDRAFT_228331 [Lottia gigantea]ESO97760.1 hypothetical protein LOTGIDRAFT_228331 [Lottia gigantea]